MTSLALRLPNTKYFSLCAINYAPLQVAAFCDKSFRSVDFKLIYRNNMLQSMLHYKYNNHDKRVIKIVKAVHINKNLL